MLGWLGSSKITSGEGPPNIICREYESSPGAWIYDDKPTGVTFVVFSDGWKKHPWKGSSIEVVGSPQRDKLFEALGRLVKRLCKSSGYYGHLDPDKLKKFCDS